jgi:hypothetical protein
MNAIENQWLLSKPLDHKNFLNLNLTTVSAVSAEVEIDLQLYMQEKLTRAINKEMNSKLSTKIPVPKKCPGTASYNPTWF